MITSPSSSDLGHRLSTGDVGLNPTGDAKLHTLRLVDQDTDESESSKAYGGPSSEEAVRLSESEVLSSEHTKDARRAYSLTSETPVRVRQRVDSFAWRNQLDD